MGLIGDFCWLPNPHVNLANEDSSIFAPITKAFTNVVWVEQLR